MENEEQVIIEDEGDKVTFDERQQAKLNALLAAERRRGELNAEEIKRAAREQLSQATGRPISEGDFLANEAAKVDAKAARMAELERMYFGSGPGCGRRANELCRTPAGLAQYKLLRQEYERLKVPDVVRAREEQAKHKSVKVFLPH